MLGVLKENIKKLDDENLQAMMTAVADRCSAYPAGSYVMTDDKAPVELLGMQVIDRLIQDEVAYYKDIYEQEGLQGVIRTLM